jgi:nicotinamide mononucleotide (NMN) deamidase PncC
MLIAFSNTWQAQAGSFLNSGVTFSTDATAQQQVAIFNGASSSFWRNAGTAITGNAGSDGMDGIAVFAPDGSLNFGIQGNLGEVVITNSSIASGDRTSWNTYCARWGL